MPPVTPNPVAAGDPTRKDTWADIVVAALAWLNGVVSGFTDLAIANGSFEVGTLPNTSPAGWVSVAAGTNTTAFETSPANVQDGAQAFSMTTPGGVTGGVVLTAADLYPISELQAPIFSWWMKSTAAGILNTVVVNWYDRNGTFLIPTTLYTSTANSLAWVNIQAYALAPTTARFFKLVVTGVNNTVPGTVYWDGFRYQQTYIQPPVPTLLTAGSGTFTTGPLTTRLHVKYKAGGGGGSGGALTGNTAPAASAGGNSTFNGVSARGGNGGASTNGSAGGLGGALQAGTVSGTALLKGSGPGNPGNSSTTTPIGGSAQGSGLGRGGRGGNGLAGSSGAGGGGGAEGEEVELYLAVTPNTGYSWVVGNGGSHSVGAGTGAGDGEDGLAGWMIIEELLGS